VRPARHSPSGVESRVVERLQRELMLEGIRLSHREATRSLRLPG